MLNRGKWKHYAYLKIKMVNNSYLQGYKKKQKSKFGKFLKEIND